LDEELDEPLLLPLSLPPQATSESAAAPAPIVAAPASARRLPIRVLFTRDQY
jgi:hypothetical protein